MANPDRNFSTFYWEIALDMNAMYKGGRNKVPTLYGYSKEDGRAERADKVDLLFSCITRIHKEGYFERMKYWEIWKRKGDLCNKEIDTNILILAPNTYEMADINNNEIRERIVLFLTRFYEARAGKKDFKYLIPPKEIYKNNFDELMDWKKITLKSMRELYVYCEKLIKNGAPYGQVEHFKINYLNHKPELKLRTQ